MSLFLSNYHLIINTQFIMLVSSKSHFAVYVPDAFYGNQNCKIKLIKYVMINF